jgi:hypothetical protein
MMSASALSAQIRAKKKKMEMDESGAVKLSGIPEDATDAEVIKGHEEGEKLSMNNRDAPAEMPAQGMVKEMWDDPKQVNQPADGMREDRKAKVRKMLAKMGK